MTARGGANEEGAAPREQGAIGNARWGIEHRYGQWLWWAENPLTKHGMRSGAPTRRDAIREATIKARELDVQF